MRVLVVGSGGREHALVWKLQQSPHVEEIYCAPGNAGIAQIARCVEIPAENIPQLVEFARDHEIGLTVVGPEAPLAAGIADAFQAEGLPVFGPTKAAAQLEASKAFAKQLMQKYKIPTAQSRTFTDPREALAYLEHAGTPIVIKADGLAAGKGVVVAQAPAEAKAAVEQMMVQKVFGQAGARIVIEEFLAGEEVSVLAFTDGDTVVPMVSAQDHKAVFDHDQGPNTGGMGAYSPAPVLTPALLRQVEEEILKPTVHGLRAEGILYRGVLYAGLMMTETGPKVLEFNVRFGDPECQVVLPRLQSDLVEIMLSVLRQELHNQRIAWYDNHTACVVMASAGYPGKYETGKEIKGLEAVSALKDTYVFHAGTAKAGDKFVTAGGRVLGVTAWGETLEAALAKAYGAVDLIHFAGAHYRRDIGQKALKHRQK